MASNQGSYQDFLVSITNASDIIDLVVACVHDDDSESIVRECLSKVDFEIDRLRTVQHLARGPEDLASLHRHQELLCELQIAYMSRLPSSDSEEGLSTNAQCASSPGQSVNMPRLPANTGSLGQYANTPGQSPITPRHSANSLDHYANTPTRLPANSLDQSRNTTRLPASSLGQAPNMLRHSVNSLPQSNISRIAPCRLTSSIVGQPNTSGPITSSVDQSDIFHHTRVKEEMLSDTNTEEAEEMLDDDQMLQPGEGLGLDINIVQDAPNNMGGEEDTASGSVVRTEPPESEAEATNQVDAPAGSSNQGEGHPDRIRRSRAATHRGSPYTQAHQSYTSVRQSTVTIIAPGRPNGLWHFECLNALFRWKFAVLIIWDAHTDMILALKVTDNNNSTTVLELFNETVRRYNRPAIVRCDPTIFSEAVALYLQQKSVTICGVLNMNISITRDIFQAGQEVMDHIGKFISMERDGKLDVANEFELFALHFALTPWIQRCLDVYRYTRNSEENTVVDGVRVSPQYRFYTGLTWSLGQGPTLPLPEDTPSPSAFQPIQCPLSVENVELLRQHIGNPLTYSNPKQIYLFLRLYQCLRRCDNGQIVNITLSDFLSVEGLIHTSL